MISTVRIPRSPVLYFRPGSLPKDVVSFYNQYYKQLPPGTQGWINRQSHILYQLGLKALDPLKGDALAIIPQGNQQTRDLAGSMLVCLVLVEAYNSLESVASAILAAGAQVAEGYDEMGQELMGTSFAAAGAALIQMAPIVQAQIDQPAFADMTFADILWTIANAIWFTLPRCSSSTENAALNLLTAVNWPPRGLGPMRRP